MKEEEFHIPTTTIYLFWAHKIRQNCDLFLYF